MTSSAKAPAEGYSVAPEHAGLTHRQILTILGGLQIGMFLAALDQMILATAIRTIADDLSGLRQEGWTLTTYLVAMAVTTPLYGKLSDIYGRKPMFLLGISVFVLGSIACSFAMSMDQLALARGLQGLGAGGLISLGLAIIADIVPPRERGRYQGYLLAIFVSSSVLGPVIGGALAGQPTILAITGWRWVFLVNVPVGLVAFAVIAKVLNVPTPRSSPRIDWLGAVTFLVALVPLLLVVERGRTWGWDSAPGLLCLAAAPVGLGAWLLAERRIGDDALVPLRLFRNGEFSRFCALGLIYGISLFTGSAMIPQYLQIVRGASPMAAGLMVLQAARLDQIAPQHLNAPGGSRIRVDYTDPDAPVLALRVQQAFGWPAAPTVADGRTTVVLHLLSPAGRPVAVTSDLASFWRTGYPQVRAELRGRYPRHPWPDDPTVTPPSHPARRQSRHGRQP